MDRREQVFFTEGFEQESDCTVVHCPSPGLTAGLGGDKNDRDLVTRGNELSLQIQTARSRQAHVEDQAVSRPRIVGN